MHATSSHSSADTYDHVYGIDIRRRRGFCCAASPRVLPPRPRLAAPHDPARDVRPAELAKLIDRADRVVVKQQPSAGSRLLYESDQRRDLDELKAALKVVPPEEPIRCNCPGSPALYLYSQGRQVGLVTNQHGKTTRSTSGGPTPRSRNPPRSWIGSRSGASRSRGRSTRGAKGWTSRPGPPSGNGSRACPPRSSPSGRLAEVGGGFGGEQLREALARGFPTVNERIRAVFAWYGLGWGSGPASLLMSRLPRSCCSATPRPQPRCCPRGREFECSGTRSACGACSGHGPSPSNARRTSPSCRHLGRQLRTYCLTRAEDYKRKLAETVFRED